MPVDNPITKEELARGEDLIVISPTTRRVFREMFPGALAEEVVSDVMTSTPVSRRFVQHALGARFRLRRTTHGLLHPTRSGIFLAKVENRKIKIVSIQRYHSIRQWAVSCAEHGIEEDTLMPAEIPLRELRDSWHDNELKVFASPSAMRRVVPFRELANLAKTLRVRRPTEADLDGLSGVPRHALTFDLPGSTAPLFVTYTSASAALVTARVDHGTGSREGGCFALPPDPAIRVYIPLGEVGEDNSPPPQVPEDEAARIAASLEYQKLTPQQRASLCITSIKRAVYPTLCRATLDGVEMLCGYWRSSNGSLRFDIRRAPWAR